MEVQASSISLQTEDAKNSVTLENKLVNDLPLEVSGTVRTPFDLASLTPDAKNIGGDNGFSVGGGQAASYGTSLDGVSTNTSRALSKSWVASNSPSVEAIDQFSVDTNGYKAEYGHAGGGNIYYASKSGTNQFHGSAYEFIRNNDFDANNWFSNRSGIANSIYKQNDFGATVGGPVWIPKVYRGKDKTFFFFSYEGFRNRAGMNGTSFTIPTPEMYNGDFSKWVTSTGQQIPIYNPTSQVTNNDGTVTRQVFPANVVPKSLFSAASQKALGVFQSSGTLAPNTGAIAGTAAYVSNNYLETGGTNIYPVNKISALWMEACFWRARVYRITSLAVLAKAEDRIDVIRRIVGKIVRLESGKREDALRRLLLTCGMRGLEVEANEEWKKMEFSYGYEDNKVLGPPFRKGKEEGKNEVILLLIAKRFGP